MIDLSNKIERNFVFNSYLLDLKTSMRKQDKFEASFLFHFAYEGLESFLKENNINIIIDDLQDIFTKGNPEQMDKLINEKAIIINDIIEKKKKGEC